MSKIGRAPIEIPQGVDLSVKDRLVTCKGPKGELSLELHECIALSTEGNVATVSIAKNDDECAPALWGLSRALVQNLVMGVSEGFEKKLEIQGVGYKANMQGKTLVLNLGYSHDIKYSAPEGVDIVVDGNIVTISGIDKQKVGQAAAEIRAYRKPEPYKGKGVRYIDEQVRRKVGKTAAGAGE